MKKWNRLIGALAVVGLLLGTRGYGQEQPGQPEAKTQVEAGERIRLPAEQSMVEVWAKYPDEVRVGEKFKYEIHVKNITDQILLNQVTIRQDVPQGFEIESSEPPMSKDKQEGEQQQNGQQQEQDQQQANGQQEGKGQTAKWVLKDVKPGETKTIRVEATSDQEGSVRTCLAISYTPALCLTTRFVKPVVELQKAVPDQASICELLLFVYQVKNTGTGETAPMVLRDKLPDGLKTQEGEDTVRIPIDPLGPGESQRVEARIVVAKTGELGSRAEVVRRGEEEKPSPKKDDNQEDQEQQTQAKEDQGQQEVLARSTRETTKISQPKLNVNIEGQQTQYVDRPFTYTVTVTNEGEAEARGGQLKLEYDQEAVRIVKATDPKQVKDQQQEEAQGKETPENQQPTEASQAKQDQQDQGQTNQEKQKPEQEQLGGTRTWDLGDLKPGQTMQVQMTMIGAEETTFRVRATASFDCAVAEDNIDTETTTTKQIEIIALPALQITLIDKTDPVPVGEEYVYEIVVLNEGAAADQNVKFDVEMPEELSFVEASGTTEVERQNGQLAVKPVDELKPDEKAQWQLRVKAESEGDIRFRIKVTSDYLERPATAEEPTRIFSTEKEAAKEKPEAKAKPEAKEQPTARPEEQEAKEKPKDQQ